jgi:hypothetical protein
VESCSPRGEGAAGGGVASPEAQCTAPPGAEGGAGCCLRGAANPDLRHFPAADAAACCAPCTADEACVGYTCTLGQPHCTSGVVAGRHGPAPAPPAAYPGALTCGYTGRVPPPELRTRPMLFDLKVRSKARPLPSALQRAGEAPHHAEALL